jgi:hypothetical protein
MRQTFERILPISLEAFEALVKESEHHPIGRPDKWERNPFMAMPLRSLSRSYQFLDISDENFDGYLTVVRATAQSVRVTLTIFSSDHSSEDLFESEASDFLDEVNDLRGFLEDDGAAWEIARGLDDSDDETLKWVDGSNSKFSLDVHRLGTSLLNAIESELP